MKVYVASSLENAAEAKQVAEALEQDGWEITYRWWEHGSVQADGDARIREVAVAESQGVLAASLVVIVLPGGRGTHTELGMALASPRAPRVLIFARDGGRNELEFNAYGAPHAVWREDELRPDGGICAFYLHPAVTLVDRDRGIDGLRLEALRVTGATPRPAAA